MALSFIQSELVDPNLETIETNIIAHPLLNWLVNRLKDN